MKFNHLRIVVTILAAFGGFFAYVCRLNLSLIIEEMVVKGATGDKPLTVEAEVAELAELAKNPARLSTEEQTVAVLSSSYWRAQRRALWAPRRQPNDTRAKRPPNAPHWADQIKALSVAVDFDVAPSSSAGDSNPSSSSTTQGPLATTTAANREQTSDKSEPGDASQDLVDIRPLREQNLLQWDKSARNDLLSAFFLGYVLLQLPGGYAAERLGAKSIFLTLAIGTGLGSLAFPWAAKWSAEGAIWLPYAVRFAIGASQGALFPAVYVLLCEWLPKSERSSWLPVPSAMGRLGTIVMNSVVPPLMEAFGWEMVFYASGVVTLAWGLLFLVLGSNSPRTSSLISADELLYIERRMEPGPGSLVEAPKQQELTILSASGFSINEQASCATRNNRRPPINWLKLVTNRPLLIMTLVMFTSEWSNMLLMIKLPGFLGPALAMSLKEVGFWSSVLVGIYCVQYPLSGFCASRLEAAQLDSLGSLRIRKLFELAAHLMQALGCLAIAYTRDRTAVICALCLMMFGRSTVGGGQCLMPPELSKDYPGSVMALANSLANLAGLVGPKLVDWLVANQEDPASWQSLWLLSAGIFLAGGLIFCLFAENRPQNFARKPKLGPALSQAQLFVPAPSSSAWPKQRLRQQQQQADDQVAVGVEQDPVCEPTALRMDPFQRLASEPRASPSSRL